MSSVDGDAAKAGRPLAPFIANLFRIVSNPAYERLVSFSADGHSFVIKNMDEFAKVILPQYYKHSNFSSFSRQLCFYSFKKLSKAKTPTSSLVEYHHPYFIKGRPDLLPLVVRKTNNTAQAQLEAEEAKIRETYGDEAPENVVQQLAVAISGTSTLKSVQELAAEDSETSDGSGKAIGALAKLAMCGDSSMQKLLDSDGDSGASSAQHGDYSAFSAHTLAVGRRSSRRLEGKTTRKSTGFDGRHFEEDDEEDDARAVIGEEDSTFSVTKSRNTSHTSATTGMRRPPSEIYMGNSSASEASEDEDAARGKGRGKTKCKAGPAQQTYGSVMSNNMISSLWTSRKEALKQDASHFDGKKWVKGGADVAALGVQLSSLLHQHTVTRRDLAVVLRGLREVASRYPQELQHLNVDPEQIKSTLAHIPLEDEVDKPHSLAQALDSIKLSDNPKFTGWNASLDHNSLPTPSSATLTAEGTDKTASGRKRTFSEAHTGAHGLVPIADLDSAAFGILSPANGQHSSNSQDHELLATAFQGADAKRPRHDEPQHHGDDALPRPPGLNLDFARPPSDGAALGLTPALAMHHSSDPAFAPSVQQASHPEGDRHESSEQKQQTAQRQPPHMGMTVPMGHYASQYPGFITPGTGMYTMTPSHVGFDPQMHFRVMGAGAMPHNSVFPGGGLYTPAMHMLPHVSYMDMQKNFLGSLGVPVAPIMTSVPPKMPSALGSPTTMTYTTQAAHNDGFPVGSGPLSTSHAVTSTTEAHHCL